MYFYSDEELFEFINDFDSHWAHGSVLLRECCRPSNWRGILEKCDEEPSKLHDDEIIIGEELPSWFFDLDQENKLQLYQEELRHTHQELNRIMDLFLEYCSGEDPSPEDTSWFDLLHEAPFDLTRFAVCSVAAEHWSLKNLVLGKEQAIPWSANMIYLTPDFGNYYLKFLNLVNETSAWSELDRCEVCERVMRKKRSNHRFCSKQCKSSHHNSQKDPKKHAAYMRDYRKKEKLQEAIINRRLAASQKRD